MVRPHSNGVPQAGAPAFAGAIATAWAAAVDGPEAASARARRLHEQLGPAWERVPADVRAAWADLRRVTAERSLAVLLDPGAPPPAASAQAERLTEAWARAELPAATLLRAAWLDHSVAWDAFIVALERAQPDASDRASWLRDAGPPLRRWVDRFAGHLADRLAHHAGHDAGATRERLERVQQVLAGEDAGSATLGYDLDRHHIGVIAWGRNAGEAVEAVGCTLGREPFAVRPLAEPDVVWAWLPSAAPDLDDRECRMLDRLEPPEGASLALGDTLQGAAGFRLTFAQAREARRIARLRSTRVTRYHEVALEAVASHDPEAARFFVRRELGLLFSDGRAVDSRTDRETLRAYFTAGQRSTGAAALLGVTDETVRNRLRRIEQRLGATIVERQAELQMALRLADVLHPDR